MVACCSVVHLWVTAAQQSSFALVPSYFQKRKAFRLARWSFPTSFWALLFGSFSLFLALSHLGPPFARHSKKNEYLMLLHLQQCEQSLGLLNFCYMRMSLCVDKSEMSWKVSPFSARSLPPCFLMESPLEHKAADDDCRSPHDQPPISPSSEYQKLADLQWMGRKMKSGKMEDVRFNFSCLFQKRHLKWKHIYYWFERTSCNLHKSCQDLNQGMVKSSY